MPLFLYLLGCGPTYAVEPVCEFVAHHPISGERGSTRFIFPKEYLLSIPAPRGGFLTFPRVDVDGDGVPDQIEVADGGSSQSDWYDVHLSSAKDWSFPGTIDEQQAVPPQFALEGLDQGSVGEGLLWLRFGGHIYLVAFSSNEDYAQPEDVKYFVPGGKYRIACVFHTDFRRKPWRPADPPAGLKHDAANICRESNLRKPKILEPIAQLTEAEARHVPVVEFRETSFSPYCKDRDRKTCRDIWRVDFDNSGREQRLLKLEAASGAGRGCDAEKFFALDAVKRQEFLPENFDGYCVEDFTWVTSGGRTLMYSRSSGSYSPQPETLSMIKGKDSGVICSAPFQATSHIVFSEH
jgi:hypothetical protein